MFLSLFFSQKNSPSNSRDLLFLTQWLTAATFINVSSSIHQSVSFIESYINKCHYYGVEKCAVMFCCNIVAFAVDPLVLLNLHIRHILDHDCKRKH